jgi:GDPmannose 4,6-dehydratase
VKDLTKRALITGLTGQDGAYLAKLLLQKGYKVYGTYRRLSSPNFWRLEYLDIFREVNLLSIDLGDDGSLAEALRAADPDEVYHLAAQSFVETSFEIPVSTGDYSGLAATRMLECIRQQCRNARFYFAGTSEMFGRTGIKVTRPLRENDPFEPMSPYAAAKLYGYWLTRIYREGYGMFAANGLLFNHESPLRGLEFVTRKVANEVAKISIGLGTKLRIGNLDARRDWGYAPEYVESMWGILQQDEPDDFVIATGEAHSVRELVSTAFDSVGLNWEKHTVVDKKFLRPLDVPNLIGDYSKAHKVFGWEPRVKFEELVRLMVKEEVSRWKRFAKGERFPWDASNYTSQRGILNRKSRS